jgi:lipoprotein-anchoring transpeptidase ErfK/SrfK
MHIMTDSTQRRLLSDRLVSSKPHRPDRSAVWVGLVAAVLILPLALFSATLVFFQTQALILPNVVLYDRDLGLLSREDAVTLIDEIWNQQPRILLTAQGHPGVRDELTPGELGLWVDPQATANAAFAVGRSAGPLEDLTFAFGEGSRIIMPVLYYDESQARKTLTHIAKDLAVQPVEAELTLEDGAWTALPGQTGSAVSIDTTLAHLVENAFSVLITGSLNLAIEEVQPDVTDLSPLLDQIQSLIAQEFHLSAYDPITDQSFQWAVPVEQKTAWVTVDQSAQQVQFSFSPSEVARLLADWEADLGDDRSFDPFFEVSELIEGWQAGDDPAVAILHNPITYHVGQGESLWAVSLNVGIPMWYIMEVNPGLTMNNLTAGTELTIPSKNILLPLPAVPDKRIIIDISDQRMTVYEQGNVRNSYIVSTGVSDSPTMAGVFQIQTHELNAYASNWDLYMPHFMGIYEAWPGFMNGIHGLPLLSSGNRLWASNLGSPASYGCIILDLAAAEDLYYWADPGVVVEIRK